MEDKKVKLYACGVTPYDYSHIGHGRSYVCIDTLVRFLRFLEYDVTYVRNVTDIDDKLIIKAEKLGDVNKYRDIAEEFTLLYQQEMGELNCVIPDQEPKVTDNIDAIIDFIKKLIEKGHAYVVDNDVYFDVLTYKEYGKLSGRKLEDLLAGARVEVDVRKKHPADFALWKGNDKKLFWESPWGHGRPGWHIECSVLVKEFLAETIDIHCGGADLIFPHHENERAQSESLHNKTFTRYWVHNALLNIDKKKMSKSLGNILSLKEIFEKYDPMILRFYFLQHHYRTPIDFSFPMLDAAKVAYKKLCNVFGGKESADSLEKTLLMQEFIDALADDLNTSKLVGILFEHLAEIRSDEKTCSNIKLFLQQVLGLDLEPVEEQEIQVTPEIEILVKKREQARAEQNWAESDKIRDQLKELGYEAQDKKI